MCMSFSLNFLPFNIAAEEVPISILTGFDQHTSFDNEVVWCGRSGKKFETGIYGTPNSINPQDEPTFSVRAIFM